eukprot:scpid103997/ scgid6898/ 
MRPTHHWQVMSAKGVIFIAALLTLLTANEVSTQRFGRHQCTIPRAGGGTGIRSLYYTEHSMSVQCVVGYYISGESQTTNRKPFICGNGAEWMPQRPFCERKTCTAPNNTTTWTVTMAGAQVNYHHTVRVHCNIGYYVSGQQKGVNQTTITCEHNAVWSPSMPQCIRYQCNIPAQG